MFDEMKQMMNMMKNVDTKKIQWFHQLMGELRKQQLEKNKKKLNDNAKGRINRPSELIILTCIDAPRGKKWAGTF